MNEVVKEWFALIALYVLVAIPVIAASASLLILAFAVLKLVFWIGGCT